MFVCECHQLCITWNDISQNNKRNYKRIQYQFYLKMETYVEKDLYLQHPFAMIVAGPRRSGKSYFVKNIIQNRYIHPMVEQIVWYFASPQPDLMSELEGVGVEFIKRLPVSNMEEKYSNSKKTLIIIDDLMQEACEREDVQSLFTRGRHLNVSLIFISQNVFHRGKYSRTMSLNADYMALFKNPRDSSIIATLGAQMLNTKFLKWAFNDAVAAKPFSHLLINLRADTPDSLRFRSDIFGEKPIVYIPKKTL